ncbi:MAG TPA: ABC transporter ATP-binding protein [Candidatus Scybalocola faecavium]|nr:ABC transporter ATP-binding protein [Candidatus Scybalocola faecavium]
MEPLLRIQDLSKYYGTPSNLTKALDKVSFQAQTGEFIGVMGASGSGKTTLLRCISTLDHITSGHIFLDGQDITRLSQKDVARFRRENLGFIFQDYNLLDTLTLGENIRLALTIQGEDEKKIDEKTKEMARRLNIHQILDKFPPQVSGGQMQRCACARAMVNKPKLLLADEPTGALDSRSGAELMAAFNELNELYHITIFMVSHDAFAASHCHRILFLKDGQIFHELIRGGRSRRDFFQDILDVMSGLGGDVAYVR